MLYLIIMMWDHIVKNSKWDKKHNCVNWEKYTNKEKVGYSQ